MSCLPGCRTPTQFQAHCSVCHRTFGGVTGFDDHRKNGECLDPVTRGYVQSERDGVWRTEMAQETVAKFRARVETRQTGRRPRVKAPSASQRRAQSPQNASGVSQVTPDGSGASGAWRTPSVEVSQAASDAPSA